MKPRKYFAYIRKALKAEDKQNLSLLAQKQEIEKYAKGKGIQITKWYEEYGSGVNSNRPVFRNIINELKAGKANGLIVYNIDRLSRNLNTLNQIIGFCKSKKIDLVSVAPQGYLLFSLQALTGKRYTDALSEETKKGQRESIKKGFYPSKPPFGYFIFKNKKNQSEIRIKPNEGAYIKRVIELYALNAVSLKDLEEFSTDEEFSPKHLGKIEVRRWKRLLSNPFYYGYFQWGGKLYKGSHEAIVTKEIWDRAQERLNLGS